MIPRVFHRIWLDDPNPIPDQFEEWWQRFQTIHPGWTFRTWLDSDQMDFMSRGGRAVFNRCTTHAGRSDVARYEILAAHGGIYVDTDVEPLQSFLPLLGDTPFIGWESTMLLCPTIIGSPPRHPAIVDLVEALPHWFRRRYRKPPNQSTGPWFITNRWRRREDIRRLDREFFYPVGWWERGKLGGPYPAASVAVHHWAQGWDPAAKARIDARQDRADA